MKTRLLFISLLIPLMVFCTAPVPENTEKDKEEEKTDDPTDKPDDPEKPDQPDDKPDNPGEGDKEPDPKELPVVGNSMWSVAGTILGSEGNTDYHARVVSASVVVVRNVKLTPGDEFVIRKNGSEEFGGTFEGLNASFDIAQGAPAVKPGLEEGFYNIYINPSDKQVAITENVAVETNPVWVPSEVKNGSTVLATNSIVEEFLTTITYPERDYTYSAMKKGAEAAFLRQQYEADQLDDNKEPVLDEKGNPIVIINDKLLISPGNCDIPAKYTIRWPKDESGAKYTVTLTDGDWKGEYETKADPSPDAPYGYYVVTNLRPNAHYTYEVTNGGAAIVNGEFNTTGHMHQLVFKPGSSLGVRNVRDLGGWKTKDGTKTVKYRMIYRGGRPDAINKNGLIEAQQEGIMAELDLRHTSDVLDAAAFSYEGVEFCAPLLKEGYKTMLRDDKERTRQVMQFIIDMVKINKPVYFHCSLGRDRTGTTALLCLGILGVDEGEISKEYECTQFAPSGYSVSGGEKVRMTRLSGVDYDGAAKFIWDEYCKDGNTYSEFKDGVEKYLLEIGISQDDINTFRSIMLE